MTIKNGTTAGASQIDLDRTAGSRPVSSGSSSASSSGAASQASDSIALSQTNDLVQLALTTGSPARSARIEQLKNLVQTNQYQVDAGAVSNSLIDAHLRGA